MLSDDDKRSNECFPDRLRLPDANAEQQNIIQAIAQANVCVDAVAGSGKTTLSLKIAEAYPNQRVLLLTFNARLKEETRQRADVYGLQNMEAHSFHAFGVKYYSEACTRDEGLRVAVALAQKPKRAAAFDIVILDETQDMKQLFYRFVLKLYQDFASDMTRLCVLGDRCQMVYEVFGADDRFLKHSPTCFPLNTKPWQARDMHTTYRLTRSMVHFINKVVLDSPRLLCTKVHDAKVDLYEISWATQSLTRDLTCVWNSVASAYQDQDIMILAPSTKSSKHATPVSKLANYLANRGRRVFVDQSTDDYIPSERETTNKILFTNFVKAKGLERKLVIILSFDYSYFKYYAKGVSDQTVTNSMYVALTRAKEKLVLIKDWRYRHLPFLNMKTLRSPAMSPFLAIHGKSYVNPDSDKDNESGTTTSVTITALCDIPNRPDMDLAPLLHFQLCSRDVGLRQDEGTLLDRSAEYNEELNVLEDTSCINGIALPLSYALQARPDAAARIGQLALEALAKMREELSNDVASHLCDQIQDIIEGIGSNNPTSYEASNILRLAALQHCSMQNTFFSMLQLPKDFAWLSATTFTGARSRLHNVLKHYSQYSYEEEVSLNCKGETPESQKNYHLTGRIDCRTERAIFEFKCVREITLTHKLQTALYALVVWMREASLGHRLSDVKLVNINSNEIWRLTSTVDQVKRILNILLHAKETPPKPQDTSTFLQKCQRDLVELGASAQQADASVFRGYPFWSPRDDDEPEDDEYTAFQALPDHEKAAIEEWFRERRELPSHHDKWEQLMLVREIGRLQNVLSAQRERIDMLDQHANSTLLIYNHHFAPPTIQGHEGGTLRCGYCKGKLPKTEDQYLRKPQRIFCDFCGIALAEKNEIQTETRGERSFLFIRGKRECCFIPMPLSCATNA